MIKNIFLPANLLKRGKMFLGIFLSVLLVLFSISASSATAYADGKKTLSSSKIKESQVQTVNVSQKANALDMVSEVRQTLTLKSGKTLEIRGMYPLPKEAVEKNPNLNRDYFPYYLMLLKDKNGNSSCFEDGDMYDGKITLNLQSVKAVKDSGECWSLISGGVLATIGTVGGIAEFVAAGFSFVPIVDAGLASGPVGWALVAIGAIVVGAGLLIHHFWDHWDDLYQQHTISEFGRKDGDMVITYGGCPQRDCGIELNYEYVNFDNLGAIQGRIIYADESCDLHVRNSANVSHIGKPCINAIKVRTDYEYNFDEMDQIFEGSVIAVQMFGLAVEIKTDQEQGILSAEKKEYYTDYMNKLCAFYSHMDKSKHSSETAQSLKDSKTLLEELKKKW